MRVPFSLFFVLCVLLQSSFAAEFSVSPGATSLPDANPGDTIYFEPGFYTDRIEVSNLSGAENSPIIIKARIPNTVFFKGDEIIPLEWTPAGEVYVATTNEHPTMLYHDGRFLLHRLDLSSVEKDGGYLVTQLNEFEWQIHYRPTEGEVEGVFTRGIREQALDFSDCAYLWIQDLRFYNFGTANPPTEQNGIFQYGANIISFLRSNHIVVDQIEIDGFMGRAMSVSLTSDFTLQNSRIRNGYGTGIQMNANQIGIPSVYYENNFVVGCEFSTIARYDANQTAYSVEAIGIGGNQLKNTQIRNNLFDAMMNDATGIHLDVRTGNAIVEGNLFKGSTGPRGYDLALEHRIYDVRIKNNLFLNSEKTRSVWLQRCLDIHTSNNLFYNNGNASFDILGSYHWSFNHNIVHNEDNNVLGITDQVLAAVMIDRGRVIMDGRNLFLQLSSFVNRTEEMNERLAWAGVATLNPDGSEPGEDEQSWWTEEQFESAGLDTSNLTSARINPNGNGTDITLEEIKEYISSASGSIGGGSAITDLELDAYLENEMSGNAFHSISSQNVARYDANTQPYARDSNDSIDNIYDPVNEWVNSDWSDNRVQEITFTDSDNLNFWNDQTTEGSESLGPDAQTIDYWARNKQSNTTELKDMPYEDRQFSYLSGGFPATLPGRIEAEDYDVGGPGVSHFDKTAGDENASELRSGDDVDLRSENGQVVVTNVQVDEWLEYTVSPEAGIYNIKLNAAFNGPVSRALNFQLDGLNIGSINIPNTGSWTNYATLELDAPVELDAGTQVLRLDIQGGYKMNWMEFEKLGPFAGDDQAQVLTTSELTLQGNAGPLELVQEIAWTQVSGPNQSSISNAATLTPTISNLIEGDYQLEFRVTYTSGKSYADTLMLYAKANELPTIVTGTLPFAEIDTPYTQAIQLGSGDLPFNWSVIEGALPSGLSLSTGVISGAPTNIETARFTVQVEDAEGDIAYQKMKIQVVADIPESFISLSPSEDAYLAAGSLQNDPYLKVENDLTVSYLKFTMSEWHGSFLTSTLSLTVAGQAGSATIRAYQGSHSDWTESNLSSENAPTKGALIATATGTFPIGGIVSLNMDKLFSQGNGTYTLILEVDSGGDDVWFASFDHSDISQHPVIESELVSGGQYGIWAAIQFSDLPQGADDPLAAFDAIRTPGSVPNGLFHLFNADPNHDLEELLARLPQVAGGLLSFEYPLDIPEGFTVLLEETSDLNVSGQWAVTYADDGSENWPEAFRLSNNNDGTMTIQLPLETQEPDHKFYRLSYSAE